MEIEKLLSQVDPITEAYHEAKTIFENLDKYSKPLLAQIGTNEEGSEAERNRRAMAHDKYQSHVMAVRIARKEYNRAWALLESLNIKTKLLQSLNKNYS